MSAEWILTSTVLILAVLLVRAVLGRKMGARLRYGLWLLVLVRLLLPFTVGHSTASPANLVRAGEETMVAAPVVTGLPQETGVAVLPDGAMLDTNSMGYPAANQDGTVTRYAVKLSWPAVLETVWIGGMAVTAAWFLFCNLLFYRSLRRSRRLLRWEGKTAIYVAQVPSPCVFGLFRPSVYLTEEAAANEEILRHVLLHETTHLRHGDHVWAFCRTVCLVLWWYHPLVWVAAKASKRDCELCCDAAVVERIGPRERTAYGRTLLAMATRQKPVTAFCAAATLSGNGRQLKARITAIARWAKPRTWAVILAVVLTAAAVGCAFTGAAEAREEPADVEESAQPTGTSQETSPDGDDAGPEDADVSNPEDADIVLTCGLHLGMTQQEVEAILGSGYEETDPVEQAEDYRSLSWYYPEAWVRFVDRGAGWFAEEILLPADSTLTLSTGIGVDSTREEILAAYPDAETAEEGSLWSAQVRYESSGLWIFLDSGNGNCIRLATLSPASAQGTIFTTNTWDGPQLGDTYENVMAMLGTPDDTFTSKGNPYVEKDGRLYCFHDQGDGLQLVNFSTETAGVSMPMGVGVGMDYRDVVKTVLGTGSVPAFPASEKTLLLGNTGVYPYAYLTPPYMDDCGGDLQFYTDQYYLRCRLDEAGTVIFVDCTTPPVVTSYISFEDLITGDGVALNMSYDLVESLVGGFDAVSEVDSGRNCRKDNVYYDFAWDPYGELFLRRYSGFGPASVMPFGITEGSYLTDVLEATGLDFVDPENPAGQLYGDGNQPGSAWMYYYANGDLLNFSAVTENGWLLSWSFGRRQQLISMECTSSKAAWNPATDDPFPVYWNPDYANVWDTVEVTDGAWGLSKVVLYRADNDRQSFRVAFYVGPEESHFYPTSVSSIASGVFWEYQEGTFRYLGDGRVGLEVLNPETGEVEDYTVGIDLSGDYAMFTQ